MKPREASLRMTIFNANQLSTFNLYVDIAYICHLAAKRRDLLLKSSHGSHGHSRIRSVVICEIRGRSLFSDYTVAVLSKGRCGFLHFGFAFGRNDEVVGTQEERFAHSQLCLT